MKSPYSYLLQETRLAGEAAEILYPVTGLGPVDDASGIYDLCRLEIHKLIYACMDYIRFKDDDGNFVTELPGDLHIEIRERVLSEYKDFIDGMDLERMVRDAETSVLARVEHYAWNDGVMVLPDALRQMMNNLAECAHEYKRLQEEVDDARLLDSYASAVKNTLAERLSKGNADDILVYRQDMIEYLEMACANIMYSLFERFFSILSCSSVFMDVRTKLDDIRSYLESNVDTTASESVPEDQKGVRGVIFTDLSESDPKATLDQYIKLWE
ncbi:MAG: hypothetical protein IKU36_03115 [Bacteroidales bacterium]|nr:hypothetical protein [Bacteroidales bacterium]